MSEVRGSRRRLLLLFVAYGVAFAAFFYIGRVFGTSLHGSIWYPPAGLRFSILLIFGAKIAPILALVEPLSLFISNSLSLSTPVYTQPEYLLSAALTPLAYGLILALLRRWFFFEPKLDKVRDVSRLTAAALLVPLFAILLSRAVSILLGIVPENRYVAMVVTFWLGDVIGILMLTPLLLLLWRKFSPRTKELELQILQPGQSRFLVVDAALIAFVLLMIFALPEDVGEQIRHIHWYLAFLPILWAAFQRGIAGAVVTSCVLAGGSAWLVQLQVESNRFYEIQMLTIIFSASALLVGAAISHRNVTQTKLIDQNHHLQQTQDHLESKNRELERRNDQLGRFFYSVSHDLKSPVFTIQSYLGYLAKDLDRGDRPRFDADLERIRKATGTLGELLDGILETAQAGSLDIDQEIDPGALARRAASLLDGRLSVAGVAVEICSDWPLVNGDPIRIQQVFQNLLENAIKFTKDQADPRVEIGVFQDSATPTFYVRDNGVGIEEVYHTRIFQLFEKLDHQSQGRGLGLALVQRIVEEHGGRIWVESEGIGQGTTFFFTLEDAS